MEKGGLAVWAVDELDALRAEAGVTVARFCEIAGIPRATWYRWRSASSAAKGPWPTPAQDAVEADAKTLAADWDGWGHRKLAALKHELIDRRAWPTRAQARQEITLWVCGWYNHHRLHSAIGMVPPVEYEHAHTPDPHNQPLHD